MFAEVCTEEALRSALCSKEDFRPFPAAADRVAWAALPDRTRDELVARGEQALDGPWPPLPATVYLEFARTGDRSRYQAIYSARRTRLNSLVLAECVERSGRFVDAALDGIWAICEESSWCVPAHGSSKRFGVGLPDTSEPVVALFSAETAAQLCWTLHLIGDALDAVSPVVRPRIEREVRQRLLDPCMEREFGWMAFDRLKTNNWTPWVNSNWLACLFLVEADPDRRAAAAARSARSLDRFLLAYGPDGGCDEGPSYWGHAAASLVDALDWLDVASGGQLTFWDRPLVREMVRYIARVHIHERYFANFADGAGWVGHSPALIGRCGQRIGDDGVVELGNYLASVDAQRTPGAGGPLARTLWALFGTGDMERVPARAPYMRDVWLPDTEVFIARDKGGSPDGFCVVAKAGHNGERHNHCDVGNFILHSDGLPVIVDAGVGTYSRKTFSGDRYKIWTMQSSWHNLPEINGAMQAPGPEFAARDVVQRADEACAELSADIAEAYPAEAGVRSWKRRILLRRGEALEVTEQCEFASPPKDVALHLLTPCEAVVCPGGQVEFRPHPLADGRMSGRATLEYDPEQFEATVEEQPLADPKLTSVWGERLMRLKLRRRQASDRDEWTLRFVR